MDWKQRALYQLMSDISEECYCAGWMHGNEYTLWRMASDPAASRFYGRGEVEADQLADLLAISAEIGGWIRWRDDDEDKELPVWEWGAVFTPMDQWLQMYERHTAARIETPNARLSGPQRPAQEVEDGRK